MKPHHLFVPLSFATLLLTACSGGEEAPPTPTAPSATTATAAATAPPGTPPLGTPDAESPSAAEPNTADAAAPPQPDSVALEPVFGELDGERPVELIPFGGGFLLADQAGLVTFLADGAAPEAVLDLTGDVLTEGNEEGLLSIQLDPAYPARPYLWAYYSAAAPRRTVLARFEGVGGAFDRDARLVVLEIPQPFPNHNGGAIRFGPDGMLYLGLGDGGSGGDPQGHGQNPQTLLGSIIRIDVSNASRDAPYAIPSDNPYAQGGDGAPEVWAYGLRNPWRMAFDPVTGLLWTGDVGQDAIEEINRVEAGMNYGWARLEGRACYNGQHCSPEGTIFPWATYTHADGCSITGGVVYRGHALPALVGHYLYADFCSGLLWAVATAEHAEAEQVLLIETGHQVASFAEGPDHEVYLLTFDAGILRLVAP